MTRKTTTERRAASSPQPDQPFSPTSYTTPWDLTSIRREKSRTFHTGHVCTGHAGVRPRHVPNGHVASVARRPGPRPRTSSPRASAVLERGYHVARAVAVAQLVEPRVVVPVVGGSSPLCHPPAPPAGG